MIEVRTPAQVSDDRRRVSDRRQSSRGGYRGAAQSPRRTRIPASDPGANRPVGWASGQRRAADQRTAGAPCIGPPQRTGSLVVRQKRRDAPVAEEKPDLDGVSERLTAGSYFLA